MLEKSAPRNDCNANSRFCGSETPRVERTLRILSRFYAVMGNAPEAEGSLTAMAEILVQQATDDEIGASLNRCMHECRFPVRISDILQRLRADDDAEARRAWDALTDFVERFVQSDLNGKYAPEQGLRKTPMPVLSQRILDVVRRTGSWRAYKCMTAADFPFQQKRFFDEYAAWNEVNSVPAELVSLAGEDRKQLPESSERKQRRSYCHDENNPAPLKSMKQFPEPLTAAQIADRREMLRQQAASLRKAGA